MDDQIRPSCSCAGLEREEDGRDVRFTELTVPAGGEVTLSLRVGVRGGETVFTDVAFRTNDPDHPRGMVRAATRCRRGGAVLRPDKPVVSGQTTGVTTRHAVEVHDPAGSGRTVERVVSDRPDAIRVTAIEPGTSLTDGVIGRFVVEVRSDRPVSLDDTVRVFLRLRAPMGDRSHDLSVPVHVVP